MKNFEYAQPRTEAEALRLLSSRPGVSELLAGGTDLVGLMKKMIVTPERVVNVGEIDAMRQIDRDDDGSLIVGASVHLDEFLDSSLTDTYPSVKQAIQGINSIQLQAQGTLVGELLRRPMCWYYRDGHGLLANEGRMVVNGDNRYHAILGNQGPAKFVSASRLAPALIALDAEIRIVGPEPSDERILPLDQLYRIPRYERQRENGLLPNQLVTHVILPPYDGTKLSASYEVRHGEGPDSPLAAASVCLNLLGGICQEARVVLGQVAPVPWVSVEAERALQGRAIDESTAAIAGREALAGATPLSHNEYKVQQAEVAVKRAILRAVGLDTGGF